MPQTVDKNAKKEHPPKEADAFSIKKGIRYNIFLFFQIELDFHRK